MQEITIIDYIGNCDNNSVPTGHVVKTLNETMAMLEENFSCSLIITRNYEKYVSIERVKYFFEHESSPKMQNSLIKKLKLRCRKIWAVKKAVSTERTAWFLNTDFWFFVALCVTKKRKGQRIFATNYIDYYSNGSFGKKVKNYIYKVACRKIDCVFTTDRTVNLEKHVYIPDYWYDKSKYESYKADRKRNAVYICGGINAGKDIHGAVEAFNCNGQQLVVCGNFDSEKLFDDVKKIANNNIHISNGRVDEDEYYHNLGAYQYVLLPYKKENYTNRSSGIILEAIFLDAVVIAPRFLLNHLGIEGIGYDNITELKQLDLVDLSEKVEKIVTDNKRVVDEYNYINIKKKYLDALIIV